MTLAVGILACGQAWCPFGGTQLLLPVRFSNARV